MSLRDQIFSPTFSGLVDLVNPDPATITAEAMAHGLALINRWCGSTETPVAVAQHSELVYNIFRLRHPELADHAIHALLHDAHEYLLGDIITPTVKLLCLRVPGLDKHIEAEKARLDAVIRTAFDVPAPSMAVLAAVHEADQLAATVEWFTVIPAANGQCPFPQLPRGVPTRLRRTLRWHEAEDSFRGALKVELGLRRWEDAA
ncbi:MAG TPA: hypothetical protein VGN80_19290 [Devosiaceae bacterium]|jgi:hypothetical protein|nr:hypothetical protein [Devosiaceae bacterium]